MRWVDVSVGSAWLAKLIFAVTIVLACTQTARWAELGNAIGVSECVSDWSTGLRKKLFGLTFCVAGQNNPRKQQGRERGERENVLVSFVWTQRNMTEIVPPPFQVCHLHKA